MIFNFLAVAALITLVVTVGIGVADLARECWSPEHVDIPPGYRILPRRPFDYERDG